MGRSGRLRCLTGFGYDINDLFYWEHRMGTWGAAMHTRWISR
jgi:hypothetical protein